MSKVKITITNTGLRGKAKQTRGPLNRRRAEEFLPRRLQTTVCAWFRDFPFSFENYRGFTEFTGSGPLYYNGTDFTDIVTTGIQWFDEQIGISKGNAGSSGPSSGTHIEVEPFDPDALPLTGSVTVTVVKSTGACTVTTPLGTHTFTLTSDATFPTLAWHCRATFKNFYIDVHFRKPVAGGTGSAGLTATAAPAWVLYGTYHFTVERSGDDTTITGINIAAADGQDDVYFDGSYAIPIPSPCNDATADAQAELARQSFEDEITALYFIRNVVFS